VRLEGGVDPALLPYRPCAGVMLVSGDDRVFVGRRIDMRIGEAWQMPQGGIDPGESARDAAIRELGEEAGIAPHHIDIVAESAGELIYDLPPELIGRVWQGRYRGQRQRWFLCRFLGEDADIDIATEHPEFEAWKWIDPRELPLVIVPFKQRLYRDILAEFGPLIGLSPPLG
jgi:putative (di)nucleoside polyphosphate hydrolase